MNEGDVTDIGSSQINSDGRVLHSNVQIVFDKALSTVRHQSRGTRSAPLAICARCTTSRVSKPCFARSAPRCFSLVNTTNFSIHSSITGGSDVLPGLTFGTAWSNLTGYGVADRQPGMMAFITHPTVYANMTSTTDFYQESVVGISTAEQVQQKAMLALRTTPRSSTTSTSRRRLVPTRR